MSKGKRADDIQKPITKKVLIAIAVVIVVFLFGHLIKSMLKHEESAVNSFSEISYFTMYENGKWGVINSKGETIIEAGEDNINEQMIIVPNSNKDVFICMYDVNTEDGTYQTKAINSKKEDLFTSYDSVEALNNYDGSKKIWYESNCLRVKKDDKYGLIDLNGNEILSCDYDKIETIKGVENSIIIQKDGLVGLVNASGNVIINPEYKQIIALTGDYSNGYIVKNQEDLIGLIGIDKTQILECKYSDIKHVHGDGMYVVKTDDKWFIVKNSTEEGKELSEGEVKSIKNGTIVIEKDSKYGVFDIELNEKIASEYDYLEQVFGEYFIAKKDDKYGIINIDNEEKLPYEYTSLSYDKKADAIVGKKADDDNIYLLDRSLSVKVTCKEYNVKSGYIIAKVEDDIKYYNLKLEEKTNRDIFPGNTLYTTKSEGKYGLVNRDGKVVVSCQYDDITEQNEYGYIAVKKDNKWGIIDQYGNTVVEPKYQISDISKVKFVGKWHQADSDNMEYFICE